MRAHSFYRRFARGFTLLEILIVVAIIATIAAIAFPAFARSRIQANEMVSISTCRTLSSCLESYRAAQTPPAYPLALDELSSALPAYIDDVLTSGTRRGYEFEYSQINDNQYELIASPEEPDVTGIRDFYVDETGVIRSGTDDSGTPIE